MKFFTKKTFTESKPLQKHNRTMLSLKLAIGFTIIAWSIYGVVTFINSHEFRSPILFQNPIPLKVEQINIISPIGSPSAKQVSKPLTDEEYIRAKFGKHGDIAVAIAKAESGLRADAVNVNNNNSVDVGCWQVNSIHFSKGVSMETLLDCKKATDWVYDNLYLYQGFNPWVAFKTGSYLAKL